MRQYLIKITSERIAVDKKLVLDRLECNSQN
jgi:hypothetical protein